jgi:hypothetical protein
VTIDAILPDVGEDRLDMAGVAVDLFVHSPQRIPCFIVIEFRDGTNRFPTRSGVTVLAGNR